MDAYEKKYKKALLKARVAKQNTESAVTIGILEEIFPELAESEDEIMKKTIIHALCGDVILNKKQATRAIDWLEKQGSEENKGNLGGISSNSAWSEEDEVKINRIVACLENLNIADNDILLKDVEWLKSFKERKGG